MGLREIEVEETRRGNARSWGTSGTSLKKAPQYGAATVLWRVSQAHWGGGVGFFVDMSQGRMVLLDGNQGMLLAYRLPVHNWVLESRWSSDFPVSNIG